MTPRPILAAALTIASTMVAAGGPAATAQDPSTATLVERAGRYVEAYEQAFAAIGGFPEVRGVRDTQPAAKQQPVAAGARVLYDRAIKRGTDQDTEMMTLAEFKAALTADSPPPRLPPLLRALWHDAKGDWEAAHGVAQDVGDEDGAWVHAYLHRKEGDATNAGYWYRRAGRPHPTAPLQQEWDEIATALLATSERR